MKKELMQYVGNMQQLAYIRQFKYSAGRAGGMTAFDVQNGDIRFSVLGDKCLDIADFTYKGMNISFLSKPGIQGRNAYDTHGDEALRSIMGGMLFTAGLENICAPCSLAGKDYPMHGRIRTTPAEHLSSDASWSGEQYVLSVSGEMREAELFGENMVLRRRISTCYGENSILLEDEIENQSFTEMPMMLLYHFNIGYPMLDESVRIYLPVKRTTPRDAISKEHVGTWNSMESPRDEEPEYVYTHELYADDDQNTMVMLVNENKAIGVCWEFNKRYLPYFHQWKSRASGDYVIGFEPANSSIYGRAYHQENGDFRMLKAFEKERIQIKVAIVEGGKEIEEQLLKIDQLKDVRIIGF